MAKKHPELYKYSNDEIHNKLFEFTGQERKLQNQILILIQEVMARSIFLDRGYNNMMEYLIKEMKYSESTAARRLSSARILNMVPEAKESLRTGEINMTQLQKASLAIKQVEKTSDVKIVPSERVEMARALIQEIKNKNTRETEIVLEQKLGISLGSTQKETHHKDESVSITLNLSKDQLEKFNQVKQILSHKIPSGHSVEILEHLCDRMIQKSRMFGGQASENKDLNSAVKANKFTSSNSSSNNSSESSPISSSNSISHRPRSENSTYSNNSGHYSRKSISLSIQKQIFQRDKCCQYHDPLTEKKCASRNQLEIDHKTPVWAGGKNDINNLQLLCKNHNYFKYKNEARIK